MIHISEWAERYPVWGAYFARCVKRKKLVGEIFLCDWDDAVTDDRALLQSALDRFNPSVGCHLFVMRSKESPHYLPIHHSLPVTMDVACFEQNLRYLESASAWRCDARFFLAYHPWAGHSHIWEVMGDRWWPTYAWLQGWSLSYRTGR